MSIPRSDAGQRSHRQTFSEATLERRHRQYRDGKGDEQRAHLEGGQLAYAAPTSSDG
jgi:hypothetical protein